MISLKPVDIDDKLWIDRFAMEEDSKSADFCFTTIFAWSDTYRQRVGQYGDRLILKLHHCDPPIYSFPIGSGDLKPAIEALISDSGPHLKIRGVTKENLAKLEALFPNRFEILQDTYAWDYIYLAEKMAELSGKKLHAKRNHINRFISDNPNWCIEPITPGNLHECVEMNAEWVARNASEKHESYNAEVLALKRVFGNFAALKLEGAVLRVNGVVVAYTIGEKLNSDTYVVHFEKAFSDVNGAYTMINREFARYICRKYPEVIFINREEDMGRENLRKAKQSYYPDRMVEKYTAVLK